MKDWIGWGIGIVIAVTAIGIALNSVFGQSQSGWDAGTIAIWALVGIAIVGSFITTIYVTKGRRGSS